MPINWVTWFLPNPMDAAGLLKQFGWEEGKGLGKDEGGIKESIKVTQKLNTKGVINAFFNII